jgi:chromosome segregation ATPase
MQLSEERIEKIREQIRSIERRMTESKRAIGDAVTKLEGKMEPLRELLAAAEEALSLLDEQRKRDDEREEEIRDLRNELDQVNEALAEQAGPKILERIDEVEKSLQNIAKILSPPA